MTQAFIIRRALTRDTLCSVVVAFLLLIPLLLFAAECIVYRREAGQLSFGRAWGRGSNHKRIGNGTMQFPFEIKVSRHKGRQQHQRALHALHRKQFRVFFKIPSWVYFEMELGVKLVEQTSLGKVRLS